MDQHPELVQIFATDNLAYITDIDTEVDLSALNLKRF
jgi:hypothetical protein